MGGKGTGDKTDTFYVLASVKAQVIINVNQHHRKLLRDADMPSTSSAGAVLN